MKTIKVHVIKNFMEKNKMTKLEFCKRCGISYDVLKKFLTDNPRIKINDFFKVTSFLNIKAAELLY